MDKQALLSTMKAWRKALPQYQGIPDVRHRWAEFSTGLYLNFVDQLITEVEKVIDAFRTGKLSHSDFKAGDQYLLGVGAVLHFTELEPKLRCRLWMCCRSLLPAEWYNLDWKLSEDYDLKVDFLRKIKSWRSLSSAIDDPYYEASFLGFRVPWIKPIVTELIEEMEAVIQAFDDGVLEKSDFDGVFDLFLQEGVDDHKTTLIEGVEALLNKDEDFPLELRERLRSCFAWAFPEPLTE